MLAAFPLLLVRLPSLAVSLHLSSFPLSLFQRREEALRTPPRLRADYNC